MAGYGFHRCSGYKENRGKRTGRSVRFCVVALFVALVVLCAAVLTACNDNRDTTDYRRRATDGVTSNLVAAINENWSYAMKDEDILKMDNPGTYVVACIWAERAGSFLYSSDIQTAKIQSLADFLATDEGKNVVRETADNLDGIITMMNTVGFTSGDVQETVFDGAIFVVSQAQNIYETAKDKLDYLLARATGAARTNIEKALQNTENVLAVYRENPDFVSDTVAALKEAETGIKALADFSYRTAWIFGGGENGDNLGGLLGAFQSGALANISDRELFVYLDGVVGDIRDLRAALTDQEISALSSALQAVENMLSTAVLPTELFENVTGNSGTTRMDNLLKQISNMQFAVDWLQDGTDFLLAACDLIYEKDSDGQYTYRFVNRVKQAVADKEDKYTSVNGYILFTEMLVKAIESTPCADLQKAVGRYKAETDLGKLAVMFGAEGYLKLLDIAQSGEIPDGQEPENDEMLFAFRYYALETFKASYRTYLATGDKVGSKIMGQSTKTLTDYIAVSGIYHTGDANGNITQEWYDVIVNKTVEKLTADAESRKAAVVAGLQSRLAGWYGDIDKLRTIAAHGMLTAETPVETIEQVQKDIESAPVWLNLLMQLFFGGK